LIGVEPPAREKKLSWDSYHEWGNIFVRSIWSFLKIQRKNCWSQELFFDLTSCLTGKLQWWSSGQIQHTRKQSCWGHQMQLERIALTTGHNRLGFFTTTHLLVQSDLGLLTCCDCAK
jgi:hypothetical protein